MARGFSWTSAGLRKALAAAARRKPHVVVDALCLVGAGAPSWATINDVRDWDDMDECEGGDQFYAPVNAGPIGPRRRAQLAKSEQDC